MSFVKHNRRVVISVVFAAMLAMVSATPAFAQRPPDLCYVVTSTPPQPVTRPVRLSDAVRARHTAHHAVPVSTVRCYD
jgi:hypothetical protein